jgi:hypothetical protein
LHLEPCIHGCPNEDVCYLKKRVFSGGYPLPPTFKDDVLEQGFQVYDALCRPLNQSDINRLETYDRYHITISSWDYENGLYPKPAQYSQIQKSIYRLCEKNMCNGPLQLFLIKDNKTFSEAINCKKCDSFNNIHFSIDRNWNGYLDCFMLQDSNKNISVDSCLTSWMVNNECPYKTSYIDISHDWTVRNCPFTKEGISIPEGLIIDKNYIDLFSLQFKAEDCAYEKYFKKD